MLGLSILSSTPAVACGIGQVPKYSDISAVRYEKTACYGVCPNYEVLFSNRGLFYVGRSNVAKHGTYESSDIRKFAEAVSLLSRLDFFAFRIKPVLITDVPHYIVAVERCGVTTKLDWPAAIGNLLRRAPRKPTVRRIRGHHPARRPGHIHSMVVGRGRVVVNGKPVLVL